MALVRRGKSWGVVVYREGERKWVGTWPTPEAAREAEIAARGGEFRQSPPRPKLPVIEEKSVVYFVSAPSLGLVKIGYSTALMRRYKDLEQGSPVPLTLLGHLDGDATVEAELHRRFRLYRVRNEWFRIAGDLEVFLTSELEEEPQGVRYLELVELRASA